MKITLAALLVLACVATGCAGPLMQRSRALERVAKDWSLAMRANQITPVYPPTSELRPGDLFLVQTPIVDQVNQYLSWGFLPLEVPLARLSVDGEAQKDMSDPAFDKRFHRASVVFPSFAVRVERNASAALALPLQSVSIGLDAMRSSQGICEMTLSEAYSLSGDTKTLLTTASEWVATNRPFIEGFSPAGEERRYLRLITTVYLVNGVDVFLMATDERSSGGEAKVPLPESLNLASGTMKLKTFTGTAIGVREPFDPPMVIGYRGIDLPLLDGGGLGLPVATEAQLRLASRDPQRFRSETDEPLADVVAYLRTEPKGRARLLLDEVVAKLPLGAQAEYRASAMRAATRETVDVLDRAVGPLDQQLWGDFEAIVGFQEAKAKYIGNPPDLGKEAKLSRLLKEAILARPATAAASPSDPKIGLLGDADLVHDGLDGDTDKRFTGTKTFTVEMGLTLDPKAIERVEVWVDADGLKALQVECDKGNKAFCSDYFRIDGTSAEWATSQGITAAEERDPGESGGFRSDDAKGLSVIEKVASGTVRIIVAPSTDDECIVNKILIVVWPKSKW